MLPRLTQSNTRPGASSVRTYPIIGYSDFESILVKCCDSFYSDLHFRLSVSLLGINLCIAFGLSLRLGNSSSVVAAVLHDYAVFAFSSDT